MCSRLVNFSKSLRSCDKFAVRFLASMSENDNRTVLGQNLQKIRKECSEKSSEKSSSRKIYTPLTKNEVKQKMNYSAVPESEKWRVPMLLELLDCRNEKVTIPNFSTVETEDILHFICTS